MADKTGISWTDATWSPVVGCSRVSEGCRNCYSERLVATRLRHTEKYSGLAQMTQAGPRWTNVVRCVEDALLQPLRWSKPRRIFVNSMSDTFHKDVPDEFLDRMFAVMALCPQHTFQVLTKRPERAAAWFADDNRESCFAEAARSIFEATGRSSSNFAHQRDRVAENGEPQDWDEWIEFTGKWPLPNVWIGTSVENQAAADERIPHLLKIAAAVRFLSCEPLLGPVDIEPFLYAPCRECEGTGHTYAYGDDVHECRCEGGISQDGHEDADHWVICGGESGPSARPMHPDWARSLRDQCAAAGVPFHFKQWGEHLPVENNDELLSYGTGVVVSRTEEAWPKWRRLGAKKAGRVLDGVQHDAFPEVAGAR